MRSGIHFSEDYLDPQAEVRVLEQAIGWAPRQHPQVPHTMYDYLLTLEQKAPHGGPFEYRRSETDVLGWVCEAAGGMRMPELMSRILWSALGAENDARIAVDSVGSGMYDGGICATLRDLARFGTMLAQGGTSLSGHQVVPGAWIADTFRGDPDSRDAFAAGPTQTLMPGGMYPQPVLAAHRPRVLLCLGIHGQMLYVNGATGVVAASCSLARAAERLEALRDPESLRRGLEPTGSGIGRGCGGRGKVSPRTEPRRALLGRTYTRSRRRRGIHSR